MTRAQRMTTALLGKDLRVLAPVWVGTAAAMSLLAATSHAPGLGPAGAAVYALGSVALGAMAIGHEFRHGTMASLLAGPARRSQVIAMKLAVLATLLVALGAVAWVHGGVGSPQDRSLAADLMRSDVWIALPLLCGLGLAPWFTVLCRSELAGVVFAGAVPAVLLLIGDTLALMNYGLTPGRVDALRWFVVETGLLMAFAIGLFGATRAFQRLELSEGRPGEAWIPFRRVSSKTSLRSAPRRRRGPFSVLVAKELRLQAPAIGAAAAFVVGWVATSSVGEAAAARVDLDFNGLRSGLALLYAVFVATLIGALASAEERQQGTLPSQLLVPMAIWKQWGVKVGMVLGLTGMCAVAVPLLLGAVTAGPRPGQGQVPVAGGLMVIFSLPLVALYVSSLSTGGLRALLASVCVLVALGPAVSMVYNSHLVHILVLWFASQWTTLISPEHLMDLRAILVTWVLPVPLVVLLLLLVRFALGNHRRVDRSPAGIRRQLGWFVAMLAIAVLCQSAAGAMLRTAVVHRARTLATPSQTE